MLSDALEVGENLWLVCILLGRNVPKLFQERKVNIRLHVTLRARVPVSIPNSAHIGRNIDQPNALQSCLPEACCYGQAGYARAKNRHIDIVLKWLSTRCRYERIEVVVGEYVVIPYVHRFGTLPSPLITFRAVSESHRLPAS